MISANINRELHSPSSPLPKKVQACKSKASKSYKEAEKTKPQLPFFKRSHDNTPPATVGTKKRQAADP